VSAPCPTADLGELVAQRLAAVRGRIESADGDPGRVRVVAVTKGFGPEHVAAAFAAGMADVGENYAAELLAKRAAVPDARLRWHFLGSVQRNKVARLSPVVSWWHGITRVAEGTAVARRRPEATVLVEVDVTGLPGRRGCPPGEVAGLVRALGDQGVVVAGLMAVGSPGGDERTRDGFRLLRRLADELDLPERSMGMSDDLELAVAEGSTLVRVGRALFGERPPLRGAAQ
jgi:uncharacterized pyridoxal phosphate-containing UPF0001 family protein